MFANTFRTQARLALASCRARVSLVNASQLAIRSSALPALSMRALSTSSPAWNPYPRDAQPRQGNEPQKTLYIGNMPYSVEEREIREKFETFGEIQEIRIAYRPDGTSRGFAHVEFAKEADAAAAVESAADEPVYMLDRDLRVNFAERKAARTTETREPTHTLYFHGLRADQEILRNATRPFENSIVNIRFLKDRETMVETGAGFIQFMSVERATEALSELNGVDLGGNETLFLRYAYPKREDGERSNGDRRGGYGGGGRGGGGRGGGRGGYGGDRGGGYGGGNRGNY